MIDNEIDEIEDKIESCNNEDLELSYEEAYVRMEKILSDLEYGNIGLDESLKLYEEGIKLYRYCSKMLEDVELKVTKFNAAQEEEKFEL